MLGGTAADVAAPFLAVFAVLTLSVFSLFSVVLCSKKSLSKAESPPENHPESAEISSLIPQENAANSLEAAANQPSQEGFEATVSTEMALEEPERLDFRVVYDRSLANNDSLCFVATEDAFEETVKVFILDPEGFDKEKSEKKPSEMKKRTRVSENAEDFEDPEAEMPQSQAQKLKAEVAKIREEKTKISEAEKNSSDGREATTQSTGSSKDKPKPGATVGALGTLDPKRNLKKTKKMGPKRIHREVIGPRATGQDSRRPKNVLFRPAHKPKDKLEEDSKTRKTPKSAKKEAAKSKEGLEESSKKLKNAPKGAPKSKEGSNASEKMTQSSYDDSS
ncbi:hypothetical protein L596_028551 [Steinernema carpocapsae]|uniref:Uncharacterized protein n=1 Tax=Steinernema carpocapsae TaxID=34508 RepID=A0A4V5ZXX1_STECR|nr:hypothetical protein L596_028551 [Steinernema carpocapsae]